MMLAYSSSELISIFTMQGFAGLSLFSVVLLMALGLAIIFGQMGVINMAHGEFMAVGAYTVCMASKLVQAYWPSLLSVYFVPAVALAFLMAFVLGWLLEWAMIRHLYRRPLDTLLATWGVSLILQQGFRSAFGAREVSATLPAWLMGSYKPTDAIDIPLNGIFVMALFCGAIEMAGWLELRVGLIKDGMKKYAITNPIFQPSPVEPRYLRHLIFEGISVDEDGKQHYLDAHVAYRRACLNAIEYLKKFGYTGEQAYAILGTAPVEGHISGMVDIPNACAILFLPTEIFNFDINPCAAGPKKFIKGEADLSFAK